MGRSGKTRPSTGIGQTMSVRGFSNSSQKIGILPRLFKKLAKFWAIYSFFSRKSLKNSEIKDKFPKENKFLENFQILDKMWWNFGCHITSCWREEWEAWGRRGGGGGLAPLCLFKDCLPLSPSFSAEWSFLDWERKLSTGSQPLRVLEATKICIIWKINK